MSPTMSGWTRVRHGRGFRYVAADGTSLDSESVVRCKELVIPPAWEDVWICPLPQGHLQVVGTDQAGRRQYIYHPEWRLKRDNEKFDHMLDFATRVPSARRRARKDLASADHELNWASAASFLLLDMGMFRIGSDRYLEENGSYGLTTLERRHASFVKDGVAFGYVAKSGQHREITITNRALREAIAALRNRRGGSDRLLAHKAGRRWKDLTADDVTAYIKIVVGESFSAKDFRTWHGTVIAAASLARSEATSPTARKRAVASAMRDVAEHLGNTPSVARAAYVDPRVLALFEEGITVDPRHRVMSAGSAISHRLEADVLGLLRENSG
ncbi:DNA topoisomerase IB [soil metagenome]